jgi:hypothetical protein
MMIVDEKKYRCLQMTAYCLALCLNKLNKNGIKTRVEDALKEATIEAAATKIKDIESHFDAIYANLEEL